MNSPTGNARIQDSGDILIVDDTPANLRLLSGMLVEQGYKVRLAPSGRLALMAAQADPPDLILLDIMMPEMDGYAVCEQLKAEQRTRDIPVIFISAIDELGDKVKAFEIGAVDYVTKPFQTEEVLARVETQLTIRRLQNSLLLLERTKFEWVVEQASDGYLMVTNSGKVLYANPQACLYLGLPPDRNSPISKTLVELAEKQYRCEPREAWTRLTGALQSPRYLVRPESPKTKALWLRVDILKLPAEPDTSWMVRLRDITREVALQQDMERFHLMMRHKLRTPLMIMSSSLELLANFGPKLSDEEILGTAKNALKGMKRLHSEVEDVLQYLDAPGLARLGEGFNLSQLQPLVAEISASLGLESVIVSGHESLVNSRVLLSQRGIELALWEILDNSRKFHPKQAPTVEIVVSSLDFQVSIQISDDGLTLPPEQLAQVWTAYYQGEKVFTGEVSGMGLGLSMVASVVWEVGGTCNLHNREEGPGIMVELVLPLEKDLL